MLFLWEGMYPVRVRERVGVVAVGAVHRAEVRRRVKREYVGDRLWAIGYRKVMDKKSLPKSFDALIKESDVPVLVDFWAAWCGPCRMVSPTVERIAKELKGKILTVKVNVDQKQHLAAQYQIASIPTIMLFHQGQVLMRLEGTLPYETMKAEIERRL